jgi:exoribonuclease II
MTQAIGRDSLVLYKTKPAVVIRSSDKLEILFQDGKTLSVRPKDLVVLHPGPIDFAKLKPPPGDVLSAWELLEGATTTLADLAELAYGAYTPASAWAAWEWVIDGLYFSGAPEAIQAHTSLQVEKERATRAVRAAEAQAWSGFLERVHQRRFEPEDNRYLAEVEQMAYGRRDKSRVLAELGRAQTPESAHGLLLELGVWDETFDPYPRRMDLPAESPVIDLPELPTEERRDLTHLPAFAIDDEGNRDPDDAISLDGDRLWIHVADVAALVTPDSASDLEARARGANLYLPEGVVTMLPWQATERLGLGLAEVSPALSFGLRIGADAAIADLEITPSWVRVTRLTYEEAEDMIEQEPLRTLHAWAGQREARRRQQGAVSLDLPEVRIKVIDGQVNIAPLLSLRSRNTVTELMLTAGEAVAQMAIERELPVPFTVQDAGEPMAAPQTLAEMFAGRRRMRPSQQSTRPGPHAGLGLPAYVRVTSPLRRYLDLVAHQQLRAWLAGRPPLDEPALLERVGAADAIGGAVRRAEGLARQHWTIVYLQQHPDWSGEGVIVEKMGLRATVLIPELAWEFRVHLREDLPLDSVVQVTYVGANLPLLDAHLRAR